MTDSDYSYAKQCFSEAMDSLARKRPLKKRLKYAAAAIGPVFPFDEEGPGNMRGPIGQRVLELKSRLDTIDDMTVAEMEEVARELIETYAEFHEC